MQNTKSNPSTLIGSADERVPFVVRFTAGHKGFISFLVLFYFGTIAVWNLPDCLLKRKIIDTLRIPVDCLAIEQTWNMFAPAVRQTNYHLVALITFADGSSKLYEFPRMEMMEPVERYGKEKMRKLFIDNVPTTQFEGYLPDICASLARANYDGKNPPALITVTLKMADIPEPNEAAPPPPRFDMPARTKSEILIVYKVQKHDLDLP